MLAYEVRVALLSIRRNPVLSGVIVGGIALGIAVATLFSTLRHSFAKDPLPGKSQHLYYVRMDGWDPARAYPGDDPRQLPTQLTYQDVMRIRRSDIPARQTPMFRSQFYVFPPTGEDRPINATVRLCTSDFFPMFDVPFRYGSGWDAKTDQAAEPVAVISESVNDRMFGGADSVGRTLRMGGREFRVIGVLARWRPSVKFYDVTSNLAAPPEDVFIPFDLVAPMEIRTYGNSDGWGPSPTTPGFKGLLASETCWIQYWVQLKSAADAQRYHEFLDAYASDQKRTGRFQRPINNRVTPMMAWMDEAKVVPMESTALAVVSVLFLLVCSLNLTGLLLGKFLARAPEVGVRRALGARRSDIFVQHIVECELVGLLGGLCGLLLSKGGLVVVNGWANAVFQRSDLFQLDPAMISLAIALSLAAGLVAGAYPAWRVCRIAPAVHLKLQ